MVSSGSAANLPSSVEELRALVLELVEVNASQQRRIAEQDARIAELERRLGADSSTSSKPPSSDPPYRKPPPRSSRRASGRKPGKQPGEPGQTMELVEDPDEVVVCDMSCCATCGHDLSGAPVAGVQRRQVTDVRPPPPPRVTEYQIVARACPNCAAPAKGPSPVAAPARLGPRS